MNLSPLEVERRESSIVQTSSRDWDSNQLKMEESHIKKQIKHLRSENYFNSNQSSSDSVSHVTHLNTVSVAPYEVLSN